MTRVFLAPTAGLLIVLAAMYLEGGQIASITQLTGIMIVLGGTFTVLLAAFPWQVVRKSFRIALGRAKMPLTEDLKQAVEVFRTLGNAAVLSGIAGFLIGAIHVMEHLERSLETGMLGLGVAVSIVSLLYGVLIKLFVATPMRDAAIARISVRS